MIEQSPAFKDGGLIDITFDEANPPFVNSSFNNANDPAYGSGNTTPGISKPANAHTFIESDAAGQNINGTNVTTEPAGPNTPLTYQADGKTPNPGPGDNGFIDRTPKAATTHAGATAPLGSTTISDNSIAATDPGRAVTGTGIPPLSFVGPESNTGPNFPTTNTGSVTTGTFTLVDAAGKPVPTIGAVSGIMLGAQSSDPSAGNYDPLYDPTDFTPGGGDTGSVLISPYIKPGTTSSTYYNHYSWLRTMEDMFDVSAGKRTEALTPGAGTISTGLDGSGHLGYAAQPGLRPFGGDVFNNPPTTPPTSRVRTTVALTQQPAKVKVDATKPSILVKVTAADGRPVTGPVTLAVPGKGLFHANLVHGRATLRLPVFHVVGSRTLTAVFAGNSTEQRSVTHYTFRVVR